MKKNQEEEFKLPEDLARMFRVDNSDQRFMLGRGNNPGTSFFVAPSLSYNFLNATLVPTSGPNTITFTRAGNTATRINPSGLIEIVNANLPRFDYNPGTLVINGLLIEEGRTNLCLQSENFGTTWVLTEATVSVNLVTSPAGDVTADKLVESVNNAAHHAQQGIAGVNGQTYTNSVFGKMAERRYLIVDMSDSLTGGAYAYFDLQTGVISQAAVNGGSWTGATATITAYPNGWYRCTVTAILGANNSVSPLYCLSDTSGGGEIKAYLGNGASGLYIWGAQLEQAASVSSYIPTVAASVTRNADVAQNTILSPWFNPLEGTMVTEVYTGPQPGPVVATFAWASFDDGTANNRIQHRVTGADAGDFLVVAGGVTQALVGIVVVAANTIYKAAGAYKLNNFAAAVNGSTVTTDVAGTIPVVTTLGLGCAFGGGSQGGLHLRKFNYYRVHRPDIYIKSLSIP